MTKRKFLVFHEISQQQLNLVLSTNQFSFSQTKLDLSYFNNKLLALRGKYFEGGESYVFQIANVCVTSQNDGQYRFIFSFNKRERFTFEQLQALEDTDRNSDLPSLKNHSIEMQPAPYLKQNAYPCINQTRQAIAQRNHTTADKVKVELSI